ncbi:olfactory receptor 1038-like isoform X2 [Sphaerodactylus townsendi]|uniref:olfactory receptor 1038-like isoform X2 n=1 Tax=Sphaerodactylus townsendi TaxID=933632 RepID=UPI0020262232|nr:olfactory receptor 1038-like isoform X2 [Sphaerodactylus townsendi]
MSKNCTTVKEFILLGITDRPDLQNPLFVVFLLNYIITVMGNLGIILLIRMDPHLHTPMYFFLCHLAFVDLCYSSVIAPKMLTNFLAAKKTISYNACAAQLGCFLTFMITECFLLAVMAYDRYVAICNPLLYQTIMSQRVCIQLVAVPYIYSFGVALFHTIVTFRLSFCSANVINHFYCDDLPLLALSCSDTSTKQILIYVFAGFDMICSLLIVLISYSFILSNILRIRSAQSRQKAFSTCSSHLTAVTIFYGTLMFMYLQPSTNHSLATDKIASVFYTLVIPMLNPLIYSLRNKEVKAALKRSIERFVLVLR